jgi:hypothetical protein
MTRPVARVAAVPQVTATRERYGSAMRMIQEEEVVRSDDRDGVGRDVHSGLYCLSAKARLDGGSKGQTLP